MNTLIDDESKEFISWALKLLNNELFYYQLVQIIRGKLSMYYLSNDKEIILANLQKKLIAGARQYGPPSLNQNKNIDEETEAEYLDLIGWYMLGRWLERKKETI